MIGSPDLVAFTKDDDFGQSYVDPYTVPEEFSVPLFMHDGNANPWSRTNCAKFCKDFILISEFSEQVGPQPLLTIPDDPNVFGTFDLNYFSLRIMSVDYQASFVGHLPGCGYPKINFVEDSKVVLGDSKEGAFAYVHHLTLYDLEARGFVRPFCMAYISSDEKKIMQQFQELSSEFSKASENLKAGNRKAFAGELEKKLKDLEYTRAVLHKEAEQQKMSNGCYSTRAIEKANELANVEKSFYEHKDLLKQVTSYPNRRMRGLEFLPDESEITMDFTDVDQVSVSAEVSPVHQAEEGNGELKHSYTPQLIKAKPAKCFDKRLKTLEELCDVYFFHQTMDQLRGIENTFRGDLCYIYTSQIDQFLLKKQKITNFLFEENKDCGEQELVKQFCGGNHISDNTLPPAICTMPSHQQMLEALSFPEENVHIKVESETMKVGLQEAELTESSPCDTTQENSDESACAEPKGSLSSADSMEANGMGSISDIRGCHQVMSGRLAHQQQTCFGVVQHGISSGEVLSSRESILAADCSAAYLGKNGIGVALEEVCSVLENHPDRNCGSVFDVEPQGQEAACCMGQDGMGDIDPLPRVAPVTSLEKVVKREPPPSLQGDPGVLLNLTPDDQMFSGAPPGGLSLDLTDEPSKRNLDDASDTVSCMSTSTTSDRASSPLPQGSPINMKDKKKAGLSALSFIRQYPFAQQAIFSLLSGRTLVVLGADEGTVKKLVTALTIFVPNIGKYGERVQPWLTSSFQLADLLTWKLIGLHRIASPSGSSMLHSLNRYSRYISVLDTDHKTLRCPSYRGNLISRLADHRTQIKRGSTYFTHVQSVLTELTSRAFLYTFCHHLHLPMSPAEDQDTMALSRMDFLYHQFGYSEEDCRVVRFLSEMIKDSYLHGPDDKNVRPPVFCFDYISSVLYKI